MLRLNKIFNTQSNVPSKCGKGTYIDKTACFVGEVDIGDGCYIGARTIIGQPSNYELDEYLNSAGPGQSSSNKTIIGNKVFIQPNVVISQDVIIGDNVRIDPFITVCEHSRVGDNTKIIYSSQIHENVKIGNDCIIGGFLCDYSKVGNSVSMMGSLLHCYRDGWNDDEDLENQSPIIEDHSIIGYHSLVIGNVRIKRNSFILAGAIVTKNSLGNCVVKTGECIPIREWNGKLKDGQFFRNCDEK